MPVNHPLFSPSDMGPGSSSPPHPTPRTGAKKAASIQGVGNMSKGGRALSPKEEWRENSELPGAKLGPGDAVCLGTFALRQ